MNREQPMTFGDWMVTTLVLLIPIVNVVALIYWAASSGTNINKQNYARASIAWFFISLVILLILTMTGTLVGLTGSGGASGN